ncbi:hypothetical protein [Gracilibacillus xinjiangensis]|uniref:Uncharacterized protein n=1 Tax=Gracilibacillus xinjiangensis TaxID=1193282 RepID=A0ABV8WZM1_9BACI
MTINQRKIRLNYTTEMEKAMQQAHGVGYAEYSRKLSERLKVEKERENDYEKSQRVVNDVERLLHR